MGEESLWLFQVLSMSVKLTEAQTQIAKDKHRFKVLNCGRRFGKTTLAVWELIGRASMHDNYRGAYIAPTYQQARDIAWAELKKIVRPIVEDINESRLEITLKNGSHLYLRGWESVETLRGQAFDFLVIDEVAMMRNWKSNWQEVLRPTLTDRQGHAMFISTPKGYNHFYDLFELAERDEDYAAFRFRSEDNPYLPKSEIEKAEKELTEDAFAQEYLADFRKAVGIAHKTWDRISLIEPFDVPKTWTRARGFDYGSNDPTASVRFAIDNERNWFLEHSYKNRQATIKDHARAILAQDATLDTSPPCFGDPSGPQWATEFAQYGLHITPANREKGQQARSWTEHAIEKVNQVLKPQLGRRLVLPDGRVIEDAPKLFVFDTFARS
jgi:hypothetical protein